MKLLRNILKFKKKKNSAEFETKFQKWFKIWNQLLEKQSTDRSKLLEGITTLLKQHSSEIDPKKSIQMIQTSWITEAKSMKKNLQESKKTHGFLATKGENMWIFVASICLCCVLFGCFSATFFKKSVPMRQPVPIIPQTESRIHSVQPNVDIPTNIQTKKKKRRG